MGQIEEIWGLIVDTIEAVHGALIDWGLPEEAMEVDDVDQERIMNLRAPSPDGWPA